MLANYETERRKPSSSVLRLIANEFKVNLKWLTTGEGEMFTNDEMTRDEHIKLIAERILKLNDEYQTELLKILEAMLSE